MEVTVVILDPLKFACEDVKIPAEAWLPVDAEVYGQDWLHLHRWDSFTINGLPFHINAYRVVAQGDGSERNPHDDLDADLDRLHAIGGADGPSQTIAINGEDYVIVVTPFDR